MLEEGVAAIVGPTSPASSTLVDSTCDVLQVPHLETQWNYRPRQESRAINVFPDVDTLGRAYVNLLNMTKLKSVTIIYEKSEDLIRLQEVLQAPSLMKMRVALHQVNPGDNYKKVMKDLTRRGETNFILDIPVHKVKSVLRQASEVHALSEYNSYIVTSLDLHTVSLEDFEEVRSNISGLRLVDPDRPEVNSTIRDWIFGELRYGRRVEGRHHMKTQTALMYDALTLLARALHDLDRSQTITIRPVNCLNQQHWEYGKSLINYMKLVNNIRGLTGLIEFDAHGRRTNFTLDLIALKKYGLRKMGDWSPTTGVKVSEAFQKETEKEILKSLEGRTLRVTTLENEPYTMEKPDASNRTGNDRFEGYVPDLIEAIAQRLKFKYELHMVYDGKYGGKLPNGEWDGMIKELLALEADIAAADLTITLARQEAVDFTQPFMQLGISILFKRAADAETSLFSFLSPLSLEVWLYMATAYLGVSLLMFFLARFTPYEWVNPHPCELEAETLENQFNLPNSLWFTIGSLMQQGSDLAPRAVSIRLLASMWWFFTLIMISTYTANLAAFLTASRMSTPIENVHDLAKQTEIQYGCVKGASTHGFFKKAKMEPFKRMGAFMDSARPTVLVDSNGKGIERVRKGKYAFLMESTTIDYQTARHCDLVKVGEPLDSKGYGIATPKGSPYALTLSNVLTQLRENGTMYFLDQKWWKGKGASNCPVAKAASSTSELGLGDVGGVFVVLAAGVAMAVVIVLVEFVWKTKKVPRDLRDSVAMELLKELKLLLTFRGSTRPIPKSESASMNDSLKLVPLKNTLAKS